MEELIKYLEGKEYSYSICNDYLNMLYKTKEVVTDEYLLELISKHF